MWTSLKTGVALLALSTATLPGVAQQTSVITRQQAVSIALERNPLRKAALADTRAAEAGVLEARAALLPNLGFAETATRGNDAVYVFGSRLRQQRFAQADFALNRLNAPLPFGNFSTRFESKWSLFDSFASWRRVEQSKFMLESVEHQLDRSDQEIVLRVVNAYESVLLARKRLEVAEQAVTTAQAILDRSKARFDNGLSVESDLLNAKVRRASREEELIRAQNDEALSRFELNLAMGLPFADSHAPEGSLSENELPLGTVEESERTALERRPDLKRIQAEQSAQELAVSIAKSSFGPRLSAFGSWQTDNPTFLSGGGGNHWMGGVELQFDVFTGGAKHAELKRQQALEEKIAAMRQAASDGVRLEVRRAYYDADTARRQVVIARAAVAQAQESLRISRNRYEAGLLTISDLLSTEEATVRTQFNYWDAVFRLHINHTNLELATGILGPSSAAVQR